MKTPGCEAVRIVWAECRAEAAPDCDALFMWWSVPHPHDRLGDGNLGWDCPPRRGGCAAPRQPAGAVSHPHCGRTRAEAPPVPHGDQSRRPNADRLSVVDCRGLWWESLNGLPGVRVIGCEVPVTDFVDSCWIGRPPIGCRSKAEGKRAGDGVRRGGDRAARGAIAVSSRLPGLPKCLRTPGALSGLRVDRYHTPTGQPYFRKCAAAPRTARPFFTTRTARKPAVRGPTELGQSSEVEEAGCRPEPGHPCFHTRQRMMGKGMRWRQLALLGSYNRTESFFGCGMRRPDLIM
jgi:hypothetical protein